jgi:hypothetical protein
VPVIEVRNVRALYSWNVNVLVRNALQALQARDPAADAEVVHRSLGSFLNRVYFDLRNLGFASPDRALNYAATNAFQAADVFAEAVAAGMELDDIAVEKSPFCRLHSNCWDVRLKFFDPENTQRAPDLSVHHRRQRRHSGDPWRHALLANLHVATGPWKPVVKVPLHSTSAPRRDRAPFH